MKRTYCRLVVLIGLIVTGNVAHASSLFQGTLNANQTWEIIVDSSGVSGRTALTIFYLGPDKPVTDGGRPGKVHTFHMLSVEGATRATFADLKIPKGTRRIILEVHVPRGQTASVDITQAASSFTETLDGGGSLLWEVE